MTKLQAINNKILATDGKFHIEKSDGGIYLPDISDKATGLIPRWFKVYSVGDDIDYINPDNGFTLLTEDGSKGFKIDGIDETIRMIDDPRMYASVSDEESDVKFDENGNINAKTTRDEDVTGREVR